MSSINTLSFTAFTVKAYEAAQPDHSLGPYCSKSIPFDPIVEGMVESPASESRVFLSLFDHNQHEHLIYTLSAGNCQEVILETLAVF